MKNNPSGVTMKPSGGTINPARPGRSELKQISTSKQLTFTERPSMYVCPFRKNDYSP